MIMQALRNMRVILLAISFAIITTGCSNFLQKDDEPNIDNAIDVSETSEPVIRTVKPSIVYSGPALRYFNQGFAYLQEAPSVKGKVLESSRLKAEQAFNKAIEIEPQMEAAYYNLMKMHYAAFSEEQADDKNTQKLDVLMQRADNAQVLSARILTLVGMAKRQMGLFKEAEIIYLSALEKEANYLPLLANMAILQDLYLGNLTQAQSYYLEYESQLSIQGKEDKRTKNWLSDIKRRIAKSEKEKS